MVMQVNLLSLVHSHANIHCMERREKAIILTTSYKSATCLRPSFLFNSVCGQTVAIWKPSLMPNAAGDQQVFLWNKGCAIILRHED